MYHSFMLQLVKFTKKVLKYICRYLGSLKQFVRNKAYLEGSIAEAYVVHECLTWCSLHLEGIETTFNRPDRNNDSLEDGELDVFTNKVGYISPSTYVALSDVELQTAAWYIINNCQEIQPYLE